MYASKLLPLARPLAICCAALALSACVTTYDRDDARIPDRNVGANCEPVSMTANAATKREARAIAINSLKLDAADVRGNMISSGLKRIRVTGKNMRCGPYILSADRTECTASIILCGR